MAETMKMPFFHVDAFTDHVFGGNPAVVCPLDRWLSSDLMQKIAMENSVAETAFFVGNGSDYEIRWFTPEIEMDLCGHATLAAAHVLARHIDKNIERIRFQSKSGELRVQVQKDSISLDFPSRVPVPSAVPDLILSAFNCTPVETLKSRDFILVFESEAQIRALTPDKNALDQMNLDPGGIVVTSRGADVDFVSRFFTPQASIFEDPVTGSAHCSLVPYWAKRLSKSHLTAQQLSARGGTLDCTLMEDRIMLTGRAITYSSGSIYL